MARYSRRSALRLTGLAAVGAVAGCSSAGSESSPTARTETSPAGEGTAPQTADSESTAADEPLTMGASASSDDGRSVTIARPRLQTIVVTPDEGSMTHARPAGRAGSQFLTVDVSTEDSAIDALALDAVLDGEPQGSSVVRHSFQPGSSGSLSLAVPVTQASRGTVEWRPASEERYQWALPPAVVSNVGAAPAFDAVTFEVPETLAGGEPFTATVTVSNDGDRDGVFRAMVLDQGGSSRPLAGSVTVPVAVGETVTHEISGATVLAEQTDLTAVLDWGLGERQATVSVTR